MTFPRQRRLRLGQTAETCAGPGAPRVRLFAPVGQGPFATFVRDELTARGMEAYAVPGAREDSGAAICLIEPGGERTMLTLPGIERSFEDAWFADFERDVDLTAFSAINLCGYEVGAEGGDVLLAFAERHPELELWFAPGPMLKTIAPARIARVNALRPVWHLNAAEVLAHTGKCDVHAAGQALVDECGNTVVVTAGGEGCYVFRPGAEVLSVPTTPVRPVDTIGAGDAHLGCVMVARAAGRTWEEACALANRVSGAICAIEGATLADEAFAALGLSL